MWYFIAITAAILFVVGIFTIRETSYLECHKADSSRATKRLQWQWMSLTWGYNRNASFMQALLGEEPEEYNNNDSMVKIVHRFTIFQSAIFNEIFRCN